MQTKKQEKDDEILASILAGAALTKRPITPDLGFFGGGKPKKRLKSGPCCAVGAGVLYKGIKSVEEGKHPITAFAKYYGVTEAYAAGVSDGFEMGDYGVSLECAREDEKEHPDYARGWAVGAAVRCSLDEIEDPVRAALGMSGEKNQETK